MDEMPGVDAGSVEYRNQSFEMWLTFAQPRHFAAGKRLIEAMRRDRRGRCEDFRHGCCGVYARWSSLEQLKNVGPTVHLFGRAGRCNWTSAFCALPVSCETHAPRTGTTIAQCPALLTRLVTLTRRDL